MSPLKDLLTTEYLSKFNNIKKLMNNIAGKTKIYFPTYTNHGTDHLKNVEKSVNFMINDEIKRNMNPEEAFLLLCAIWLHDVGMIPKDDEELQFFKNLEPLERDKFTKDVRARHHVRSDNYIKENYKKLGLNKLEARIIGQIAKGHREIDLSKYKNINYNGISINVAILAAILRLADECDVSKDRESQLSPIDIDEETREEHYMKHGLINHVWYDHENETIFISCTIKNEEDFEPILEVQNEIKVKLDQTKEFLEKYGINFSNVELDINWNEVIEKEIISYIANYDFDIEKWKIEGASSFDIEETIENLTAERLFKNNCFKEGFKCEYEVYRKIFEKFGGSSNFKKFFFTKYSQDMMEKCIKELENKFDAHFKENRNDRIEILKNTPTAFYFMLKFEEFLDDKHFKDEAKIGGSEMIDLLLLMSLFNDINYYKNQIDFENIEKHIKELVKDEDEIIDLLKEYKDEGELDKSKNEIRTTSIIYKKNLYKESVNSFQAEIDMFDFNKIMKTRVIRFDLDTNEIINSFSNLKNQNPPQETFNIIIGKKNDSMEFLKNKVSNKKILFTKYDDKLEILLKFEILFRNTQKTKITVSISPKSEKIRDILNWLKFVKNNNDTKFELKYDGELLGDGKIPKLEIDQQLIDIYELIDEVNERDNLKMTHEHGYKFNGDDFRFIEYIKSLEKNEYIKRETVDATLHIKVSDLKELLSKEESKFNITFNQTPIKLLNNNIDLGKHVVSIEKAKILNKDEINEYISDNDLEDIIHVTLVIEDLENEEIILDFSDSE